MAAQQNFRTAFNGFNREDVVRYIEYINAKHTAQVNQLTSEAEFLRSKLETAEAVPAQDPLTLEMLARAERQRDEYKKQLEEQAVVMQALEERCAALEQERDAAVSEGVPNVQLAELESRCASLETELNAAIAAHAQAESQRNAALAEKLQAETERDSALRQQTTLQLHAEQELEAYRRAERTERMARERAEQLYQQANGALADATVKVDEAAAQIGEMTDRVMEQLAQLQSAVTGSKQALKDAAATMYTIRPSATEE